MLWLHIGKMLKHNLLLAHYFCPFPWQRNGCKEIACPSPKPAITEFLFCELRLNLKHFTVYIAGFVTRLTRRVPLVEQELLTLPEHMSSPLVFSEVRVTRSLVLYICFVDRCLSFCTFSFGQCVVCSSSIYGFWLSLWYLQTLLTVWSILYYCMEYIIVFKVWSRPICICGILFFQAQWDRCDQQNHQT
jgi:hypothetical protein